MRNAPSSEAAVLLSKPLICQDVSPWTYNKLKPGLAILECGLVQEDGSRAGLQIQLQFSRSLKTGLVNFKFSVFKISLGTPQLVYQLQVNAVARAPKNWHDFAHEHLGDERIKGSEVWLTWGSSEALDYFCKRANITLIPPVTDPEVFELKP